MYVRFILHVAVLQPYTSPDSGDFGQKKSHKVARFLTKEKLVGL